MLQSKALNLQNPAQKLPGGEMKERVRHARLRVCRGRPRLPPAPLPTSLGGWKAVRTERCVLEPEPRLVWEGVGVGGEGRLGPNL